MEDSKINDLIKQYVVSNYCVLEVKVNYSDDVIILLIPNSNEFNRAFIVLNNHYFNDNYILEVYKHHILDNVFIKEKLNFNKNIRSNNNVLFGGSSQIIHIQ